MYELLLSLLEGTGSQGFRWGGERGPLSPRRIATPLVSWPAMQFHCNATHFSLRDWQTHIIHRIVSTDVLHTQQHY